MDIFSVLDWKKSEIFFVMGVMVVILGISGVQLRVSQMKTRDAQRKADVELVGRALSVYLEDHQALPVADDGRIVACGYMGGEVCEWGGGPIIDSEDVVYIRKLPVDPFSYKDWKYIYTVNQERTKYKLCISLEYKADKQYKKDIQCNWYAEN